MACAALDQKGRKAQQLNAARSLPQRMGYARSGVKLRFPKPYGGWHASSTCHSAKLIAFCNKPPNWIGPSRFPKPRRRSP